MSWFKPNLKYGLLSVGQAVTENVIIAEVAGGLHHVILGIPVSLKLLNNEKLATIFKHQT